MLKKVGFYSKKLKLENTIMFMNFMCDFFFNVQTFFRTYINNRLAVLRVSVLVRLGHKTQPISGIIWGIYQTNVAFPQGYQLGQNT